MESALYFSRSRDPYRNLAAEERLCQTCGGRMILFLWQNRDTVVIGKNQSALRECDLAALRRDGVKLARRSTGGGAVFHDEGNLNFSVIFPADSVDKSVGYGIVRRALDALGIQTLVSGRNDLTLTDDRKFSGNAFRLADGVLLHHGTLLINSELSHMGVYLNPSVEKLKTHGVQSVRARVANLAELRPLTVEDVQSALVGSFRDLYDPCEMQEVPDDGETDAIRQRFASDDWLFGKEPAADITLEHRFGWGGLNLLLGTKNGVVTEAQAYTDGMDPFLPEKLAACLTGRHLRAGELSDAVRSSGIMEWEEISSWLRALSF